MPRDRLCWSCGVSSGLQRGRENSLPLGLSLLAGAYWEGFKEEALLLGLEGWSIRIKGAHSDVEHQLNLQGL